jgi:hypothetical protein
MRNLTQALEDLKHHASSPVVLSMIASQELMIAEAAARNGPVDFDRIMRDLIEGRGLDGDPTSNVEILSHIVLNLYSTNLAQAEEIDSLQLELAGYEQDPDELHAALSNFRASLRAATFKDLVAHYDVDYLMQFKPKTRKLIAQELSEYVASLHKTPISLWRNLITSDGNF